MCNNDQPFSVDNDDRIPLVPKKPIMWTRRCPACNTEMEYFHKGTRNRANRHKTSCQSCSLLKAWSKRKSEGSDSSVLKEDDSNERA